MRRGSRAPGAEWPRVCVSRAMAGAKRAPWMMSFASVELV